MSTPPGSGPARVLQPLHLTAALALLVLVWLVPDGSAWDTWCAATAVVACVAAIGVHATQPASIRRVAWTVVLPYVAFAAIWLASYWAHPSEAGARDLWQLIVFFAIIGAFATVRPASSVMAMLVAVLGLTCLQVLGPKSVASSGGRSLHYKSLDQWGGYPEIGLLAALGGSASLAIVFSTPRVAVMLASGILAAGFTAATWFVFARSALITVVLTGGWLAVIAAIRFRKIAAIAALVAAVLASVVVAVRGGETIRRVTSSAMQLSGMELDARQEGWRVAVAMMADHPWLGVGPGRYPAEYPRYSTRQDSAHAYSLFLHTGAELGILGLLACGVMWGRALVITLRAAAPTREGIAALAAHACLMAFVLRSQSEHFLANLRASERLLFVLAVLFGLAEATSRAARAARAAASAAPPATSSAPQ